MLLKSLAIAKKAHRGQTDKNGMPYWLHPYRVGLSVAEYGEDAMVVGFLHDVVEDTDITLRQLARFGFPTHVIEVVAILNRKKRESYGKYITRVEENPIAVQVKIADLTDNLREDRLRNLWGASKFLKKTVGMYRQHFKSLIVKHGSNTIGFRINHDAVLCREFGNHTINSIDFFDPPQCIKIEIKPILNNGRVQKITVVETKQKEQKQ